ncbi:DUF1697 domain-containing protein [Kitasatospora sp. NBC_01250]|uniref:DUF1697 domain-containing protein n=1 Tax=unclassified Kitasatospora TaxID=2633591 RepID=UPI002E10E46B|nr:MULTISPECIES: DUF1697 domain-containing protein [unclassified Kitasatospora]WSJ69821.1 DUF1697 domain-containing protein [Kitasatospora sp. NBC_01302]
MADQTTFIAFLRAVNVGGRTVTMERLRTLFGELGLTGVRTYIQSGNVFFTADAGVDRAALTGRIEAHLSQALGYQVPVMLRTVDELAATLALDPFHEVEITPEVRLCVVFLSEPLPAGLALPLRSPKGDLEVIAATPGEAFVVARHLPGRSAANPATVFGKGYQGHGTSRFFHTAVKILAAARKG